MDHEYINKLLDKYFEGESSLKEEEILKDFFSQPSVPKEFAEYKQHFKLLSDTHSESLEKNDDWLFEKIEEDKIKPMYLYNPWMRIAAGLLLLMIGFGAGKWYEGNQSSVNQQQFVSLKEDVKEMKQMLMLTQMQESSASERIKAVSQSTEIDEANQDIIQALISTLNMDDNVNVRLAACEALFHWKNDPIVRKGLIQSLGNQKDPSVQITIIDMLVAMKEKDAVSEIQKLAQEKDVMGIVKTKALTGVSKLL